MEGNLAQKLQNKEPNVLNKNSKRGKIILFIVFLISVVAIYIAVSNYKLVTEYEDKVYPGVYVYDTDVSGLSKSELHVTLENIINDICRKDINIAIGDKTFKKNYLNLDVAIAYDSFEEEVLSYGKDRNFFEKIGLIKEKNKYVYEFELISNKDKITEFVNSINDQVKVEPIDASIQITNGSVNVVDGKVGVELNSSKLINNIELAIKDIKYDGKTIVAEFENIEPKKTTEVLKTVDGIISTFTTYYKSGPSGDNLQVATAKVNGAVIMPGEIFSTEEAIGPTTIENGFVEANTYLNGEVVKGVGGGVCQLASTLYNTQLKAGILPTERMNHMMTVPYVPLGLDATLADNLIDLKFKNDFDYPIVINAYATGGAVTVEFWSKKDVLEGMTYEPKSYIKGLYADTWLYGYDKNGQLVYEKYIDNSTYKPFN